MNVIHILRTMHADTKMRFKLVLGADDPATAGRLWAALQPVLKLHEDLEHQFVYGPLQQEMPSGTPLGDWEARHARDVTIVQQLIDASTSLKPGTFEWRTCVGQVMDALNKHVTDEEGQIFPRIEQVWDTGRLDQAGRQMQKLLPPPESSTAKPSRRRR
jgi:hypothetical protein